ncbi:choline/carnitine/betaine transport [Mesobacillus persicus]|uniref:Choline/carnitine/betaine transport n=1 Tax=Mesobacillus persicus TaxID=930146 RepID=A0A1H8A0H8_9BACI|nr:BCCT family transporter [Mesobacillus persicus]SEM64245.1 choline/carnitine/betaine transport [Mesobacillus persicus]
MFTNNKFNSVFWVSAITLGVFVLAGALFPSTFANGANAALSFTTSSFGWLYLLAIFIFTAFLVYLIFSKYGNIRLGSQDEKPAYPLFTWIGMLFSAGFGIALVFYGVGEPMTHFNNVPVSGVEPLSEQAARVAMGYSFFHYGVSQWTVFAIVGLIMAYFQFKKKQNGLVSTSLTPLIGERKKLKNGIDILAVVATVMGVATSLGMGIMQINGGLNSVWGVPTGIWPQLGIVAVMTALFLISSSTGLDKGIKWLSNINLGAALVLMTFVFITGPTVFILDTLIVGIGDYLTNFINYSFRLNPYTENPWSREWTVFYWAWAIAWSPFVGAFVARVSRGRTIREFILGVMVAPPVVALVWIAVFGGTALHMDLFGGTNIAAAVNNDITSALFTLFDQLPLSFLISILTMMLILTFLVTSADSAVFILSSMTTGGSLNPPIRVRIIWGVLMSSIATVLLISSGLSGLQTASIVAALPFTFILLAMTFTLHKVLKQDFKEGQLSQPTVKKKKQTA